MKSLVTLLLVLCSYPALASEVSRCEHSKVAADTTDHCDTDAQFRCLNRRPQPAWRKQMCQCAVDLLHENGMTWGNNYSGRALYLCIQAHQAENPNK